MNYWEDYYIIKFETMFPKGYNKRWNSSQKEREEIEKRIQEEKKEEKREEFERRELEEEFEKIEIKEEPEQGIGIFSSSEKAVLESKGGVRTFG